MNQVEVKILNESNNPLPEYTTKLAAGFDIRADFSKVSSDVDFMGNNLFSYDKNKKELTLFAGGGRVLIPTGNKVGLPDNYELQIRPRSGMALKHGVTISNSPGTIDADYTGSIGIILINTDTYNDFIIKDADRIAQGVLKQCEQIKWVQVSSEKELGESERGAGGFGHTGQK